MLPLYRQLICIVENVLKTLFCGIKGRFQAQNQILIQKK